MSHKPKLSGAQFKKKRKEEEERNEKTIKQVPKITKFFSTNEGRENVNITKKTSSNLLSVVSSANANTSENKVENVTDIALLSCKTVETDLQQASLLNQSEVEIHVESGAPAPFVFNSDPAFWVINEELRDYVCTNDVIQNVDSDLNQSKRQYADKVRCLSKSLFFKNHQNGEIKNRTWLVYSPSKGCVFCVPCMLFGQFDVSNAFCNGFNDWKNANQRVLEHENSLNHKNSLGKLKISGVKGRVDVQLAEELEQEIHYWREVLKRVVAAVKYLTVQGLDLRGTNEHLNRLDCGNFLGLLQFLAEFDPFMAEHLRQFADKDSGSTSYVSKTTCEELIALMADKVTNEILKEVKEAKYFGIILDSTPDISNVDQLTFVLRYVTSDGVPIERFICFVPNVGHKAEEIVNAVLELYRKSNLDISSFRGQSYDNALNVSGVYSGVQARIKELSPLAEYVPCAAHSLNLVGSCAAESCLEAVSFFGLLQALFNFFSASTHRWGILQNKCTLKLQNLSKTRWSARHDACRAVAENREGILESLNEISNNIEEKPSTRNEASALKEKFDSLETTLMSIIWSKILERFDKVNVKLQYETTELGKIITYYESLCGFLQELRETFNSLESEAKGKCRKEYAADSGRKRKKSTKLDDYSGQRSDIEFTGSDNFRVNTFNVILDTLFSELKSRKKKYSQLHARFGFFETIKGMEASKVTEHARKLLSVYPEDLEPVLVEECLHLKPFLVQNTPKDKGSMTLRDTLQVLRHFDAIEIYPNIDIALRMVLCAPATNCSRERSFSALRRVKNYLRSTTSHDRLTSSALLNIEGRLTQEVQYDDIIDAFARKKARRKVL